MILNRFLSTNTNWKSFFYGMKMRLHKLWKFLLLQAKLSRPLCYWSSTLSNVLQQNRLLGQGFQLISVNQEHLKMVNLWVENELPQTLKIFSLAIRTSQTTVLALCYSCNHRRRKRLQTRDCQSFSGDQQRLRVAIYGLKMRSHKLWIFLTL